jgi:hypothetical protein
MAQQRAANYEQFFLVEDPKIRESFRAIFDNSQNLQAQIDKLVELVTSATDLADLQTTVTQEFL